MDVRVRKDRSYIENISGTNFSISPPVSSGNLDDDTVDLVYAIKKSPLIRWKNKNQYDAPMDKKSQCEYI